MVTGLRSAVSQESRTSPSVKTRRGLVLGSERPFGPWQTGTSAAPFMRSTGTSTFRDVSAEDSTITSFRDNAVGAPRADARFPGMTGWDLGVDVQIRQSVQSVNPYEM